MPRYPQKAPASTASGGVVAVDRALSLLSAFKEGDRSLSLPDLVGRTGLVKSTVLRGLASLIHFGLMQRLPDGRYTLGPEVARLQSIYTRSFSLEQVVLPVLEDLVGRTRESAVYHVRQGDLRLVLYRVDSPQPIRDHVKPGDVMPLDRGAGGRVLMAFSGAEGTLYDRIRREGVVAVVGDRSPDLAGVAAPVFGADGALAGAVTLTMPTSRFTPQHAEPVKAAARSISERLGHFAAAG
ncbi:MAG TPA: IclR family transcriptional regulator [Usitatibacter sp.]|jgi:DNA-binding IclR family transcriptional regulator|nr:IclR family transcriptional regulator [Usitatibacter sp.]